MQTLWCCVLGIHDWEDTIQQAVMIWPGAPNTCKRSQCIACNWRTLSMGGWSIPYSGGVPMGQYSCRITISCTIENFCKLNFRGKQVVQSWHTCWQHRQQLGWPRKKVDPLNLVAGLVDSFKNTAALIIMSQNYIHMHTFAGKIFTDTYYSSATDTCYTVSHTVYKIRVQCRRSW